MRKTINKSLLASSAKDSLQFCLQIHVCQQTEQPQHPELLKLNRTNTFFFLNEKLERMLDKVYNKVKSFVQEFTCTYYLLLCCLSTHTPSYIPRVCIYIHIHLYKTLSGMQSKLLIYYWVGVGWVLQAQTDNKRLLNGGIARPQYNYFYVVTG